MAEGVGYDPTNLAEPYGFIESKCPFTHRNVSVRDASMDKNFCCKIVADDNGKEIITIRREHPYFCQVQGQMGTGKRSWCDFVIWTSVDIHIERIRFDKSFWEDLLPKL